MVEMSVVRDDKPELKCPVCGITMRREFDGVRNPPMPGIFWFCANRDCEDGKKNKVYSGG